MVYDVVGFQKVEYDKKDGTGHVSGINVFIATDIPSDRGKGIAVAKEYVKSSLFPYDEVGKYDIEYAKGFNGSAYIAKITKI